MLLMSSRGEEALEALEEAIDLGPKPANAATVFANKGFALNELRKYEEAFAAYEQASKLNPCFAVAYAGKGFMLNKLQRHEEALIAYEKAIRLDHTYVFAYYGKSFSLKRLGRQGEALLARKKAAQLRKALPRQNLGYPENAQDRIDS